MELETLQLFLEIYNASTNNSTFNTKIDTDIQSTSLSLHKYILKIKPPPPHIQKTQPNHPSNSH